MFLKQRESNWITKKREKSVLKYVDTQKNVFLEWHYKESEKYLDDIEIALRFPVPNQFLCIVKILVSFIKHKTNMAALRKKTSIKNRIKIPGVYLK